MKSGESISIAFVSNNTHSFNIIVRKSAYCFRQRLWTQTMFKFAVLLAAYFINAKALVKVGTTFYIQ